VPVKMLVSIPLRENGSNELMGNQPHLPHGGSKGRGGMRVGRALDDV
jgi:hypothetical protein